MAEKLTAPLDLFKEREIEIVGLMAEGCSNAEIAERLFITKETVRWYNKQIYSKLGTSRRTEAIALAREMGLIGKQEEAEPNQNIQPKLPVTTGPFIGRNQELSQLTDLLEKPDIRLISIVAAGGMGKSRLSLELGHQIKQHLAHGAAFVDLAAVRDSAEIATATLTAIGLNASGQSPQDVLFNYCREKELILIFDNFEHILSGANFLAELLETAPNIKIIATTRERLNLRAETIYYLQPLTESGASLFREIAQMMHPHIAFKDDEQGEIDRVVTSVGALPLALILAVAWLDTLSVKEIADEIESGLEFLSSDMGDMPERQQSIHAVIEPTWARLSTKEQQSFMQASVFRGGFTRQLFQQVTGASIRILQTLLRRSLVNHSADKRYDLHPLIRQYASEQLASQQLGEAAKQAHLSAYLQYAKAMSDQMAAGQFMQGLEALNAEYNNIRAALDWSLAGHNPTDGVALTRLMLNYWGKRSLMSDAAHYLTLAFPYDIDAAELHSALGFCHYRMGQLESAEAHINKSIALAAASQDLATLATGYRMQGIFARLKGENSGTRDLLEKALELAQASGNQAVVAACHTSLGVDFGAHDWQPEKAFEHYQKAQAISEAQGDLQSLSRIFYNTAIVHNLIGDRQQARDLVARSLKLKQEIGDLAGVARRLAALATWDIVDEEFERAQHLLDESRAICEELGEQSRLQYTLSMLGTLHLIRGAYAAAHKVLSESLQLSLLIKSSIHIQASYSTLGMLHLLQGQAELALPHVRNALATAKATDIDPWMALTTYANFLWFQGKIADCAEIVATLTHALGEYQRGYVLNNNYFLQPLTHRVRQRLGDAGWQAALEAAAGITVEQRGNSIDLTLLNIMS